MPEIIPPTSTIETPASTGEPTGSPFDADETPTHQELSPADLGIDTKIEKPIERTDPTRQPTQPQPQPEDIIGHALKRGRPARDLTGLEPDEADIFKNMSLEAYNKLYPFYKQFRGKDKDLAEAAKLKEELESLKKNPPASYYYDHEDAYILQQDYRDALRAGQHLDSIESHWQQQYINARSNKPVRDLVQGPNGQLQLGPEIQPSPEVEAQIQNLLLDAKQQQMAHKTRLESLRTEHANRFKDFKTKLAESHAKIIGPYGDQLKPLIDENLKLFPEFIRGRQEIQTIAGLYALLKHVIASDKQEQQQKAAATVNRNGTISAGPTARSITTAPKGTNNLTSAEEEKQIRAMFNF